jgi:hypothetical protein
MLGDRILEVEEQDVMLELIEGIDYHFYYSTYTSVPDAVKKRCRIPKHKKTYRIEVVGPKMILTNIQVVEAIDDYRERGFNDLPRWLRIEILTRNITFTSRIPQSYERNNTYDDLIEHRINNKELSINDYNQLIKQGMKYHV